MSEHDPRELPSEDYREESDLRPDTRPGVDAPGRPGPPVDPPLYAPRDEPPGNEAEPPYGDEDDIEPGGRGRLIATIAMAALALLALLAWDPFGWHGGNEYLAHLMGLHDEEEAAAGDRLWTCSMHPEVLQDEPGQCPICHMNLVPVDGAPGEGATGEGATGEGGADQLWTCPMHPQILEQEPGSCPICGMDLVPQEVDASAMEAPDHGMDDGMEAGELWTCPMHPQILEDEPGQCPICGMDLVRQETGAATGAEAATENQGAVVRLEPSVIQKMNVTTEVVRRENLEREIRTVGYLDYDQGKMVTVTTKFPGFVEDVFVHQVGQPVRRGQPLFEIYSPELVQTQEELLSSLAYVRRLEGAPEDARRRAESLLEAARRRLSYWDVSPRQIETVEQGGEVLRTLTVHAPASGLVMKRMPGLEGSAVSPGMELFHIADLSSLWLSVEIFEDQLAWLREGSKATISLSYFPGETFTGRVRYVEPQLSESTRTVGLRLEVPNPDGRLRAGMYATVTFEPVAAEGVLTVPSQAVIRTGERNLVVVALGDGRFAPREVELGVEGEGSVEVRSGLAAGERVVTSSQFLIDSESNLREAVQKLLAEKRRQREAPPHPDMGNGGPGSGNRDEGS